MCSLPSLVYWRMAKGESGQSHPGQFLEHSTTLLSGTGRLSPGLPRRQGRDEWALPWLEHNDEESGSRVSRKARESKEWAAGAERGQLWILSPCMECCGPWETQLTGKSWHSHPQTHWARHPSPTEAAWLATISLRDGVNALRKCWTLRLEGWKYTCD